MNRLWVPPRRQYGLRARLARDYVTPPTGRVFYMATDGSNSGDGSITQPFKTMRKACSVLEPGDTLYLRGGTYNDMAGGTSWGGTNANVYEPKYTMSLHGTQAKPITIKSYPTEWAVFDGFTHPRHPRTLDDGYTLMEPNVLRFDGITWVVFEDFEVRGGIARGFYLSDAENCTFKGLSLNKHNADGLYTALDRSTGLGGRNITVEWCDFYDNNSIWNDGDSASGLKLPRNINQIVRYCRSWNNSDDGYDFYGSRGPWLVEHCFAANNGYGSTGNGEGYKLSGTGPSPGHTPNTEPCIIRYSIAVHNKSRGIISHLGVPMTFDRNTAYSNGGDPSWWSGGYEFDLRHYSDKPAETPANSAYSNLAVPHPNGNAVATSSGTIMERNSWDDPPDVSDPDFMSVDPSSADFLRLSSDSVARGAGVDGVDLGAIPYDTMHALDLSVAETRQGGVDRVY